MVPKILAATTNGIFTNQLLGITFGTLGCRQGGTVTAQVVTFTNENAEIIQYSKVIVSNPTASGSVNENKKFFHIGLG